MLVLRQARAPFLGRWGGMAQVVAPTPLRLSRALSSSLPRCNAQPPSDFVRIVEVSPRDGLQSLPGANISTAVKVELVEKLRDAGLRSIEVGSFVRPDWVPQVRSARRGRLTVQMADTPELLPRLEPYTSHEAVHYPVLVPNLRGLQNLLNLRQSTNQPLTDEIAIFIAASDGFSIANTHAPTSKILAGLPPIFQLAKQQDPPLRVRAYISTVIGCPFDGPVKPERVADLAEQMLALGAYEISLGDTTGEGGVEQWTAVWNAVTSRIGTERVAVSLSLLHPANARHTYVSTPRRANPYSATTPFHTRCHPSSHSCR